jgi:preprotein translocase subunit YajC
MKQNCCQTPLIQYNNQPNRKEKKMTNATYNVGDTFTTQKSGITGTITEIVSQDNGNTRVKLDVNGSERWTTFSVK